MQYVCKMIWITSERLGINLGWLAPYIFGGMIGRKPHRKKSKGAQQ